MAGFRPPSAPVMSRLISQASSSVAVRMTAAIPPSCQSEALNAVSKSPV
jgi:hypothetical protein